MSFKLQPHADGAPEDFTVLHGQLEIGRVYKRDPAFKSQWLWALNGVPERPLELAITGLAASRVEALADLSDRWAK
jgi:hypothetical protein